jgi:hypothetical protein
VLHGVGRKKRVLPSAEKLDSRRGRRNSGVSKAPMSEEESEE